jgi:hypothetical protein
MNTGDIAFVRLTEDSEPVEVTIIDDCFRLTEDRCTALVRLNHEPATELEIDINELFLENYSG